MRMSERSASSIYSNGWAIDGTLSSLRERIKGKFAITEDPNFDPFGELRTSQGFNPHAFQR